MTDRLLSDVDRSSEPDAWTPVPLWPHGRELASTIARVLQRNSMSPANENALRPLMSAIRREWTRQIERGAKLPQLPQLGAFVAPHGRLTLLVRSEPSTHRDVVRSLQRDPLRNRIEARPSLPVRLEGDPALRIQLVG